MLRRFEDLKGFEIGASDGAIGKVKDAYFDDHAWALRYLVVDTGHWLSGRKVLITPLSIRGNGWKQSRLDVGLTRDQVKNSPDIDTEKPVSRQHETSYFNYYGYPYYWAGPFMWGPVAFPSAAAIPGRREPLTPEGRAVREREHENADPHLRSAEAMSGYHIEATDGSIGHVADFLLDDENWSLRYFVIDTRNWLPAKHVLVSTEWVDRVSWEERQAHVSLTRDAVRESPEYNRDVALTPDDETQLDRHYGRKFDGSITDRDSARGIQR